MTRRRVPPSNTHVTGVASSRIAVGDAEYESALEGDFLVLMEFVPRVTEFTVQPVTINYMDEAGRRRRYTPDVLALERRFDYWFQSILYEVKPAAILRLRWRELRPKFKAATRYARDRGWVFKIRTEQHIRTDYLWNARFLLPYRDPRRMDLSYLKLILARLEDMRQATAEELMVAVCQYKWNRAIALSTLWHLVATFQVRCNLHARLTMDTELWLPD